MQSEIIGSQEIPVFIAVAGGYDEGPSSPVTFEIGVEDERYHSSADHYAKVMQYQKQIGCDTS